MQLVNITKENKEEVKELIDNIPEDEMGSFIFYTKRTAPVEGDSIETPNLRAVFKKK